MTADCPLSSVQTSSFPHRCLTHAVSRRAPRVRVTLEFPLQRPAVTGCCCRTLHGAVKCAVPGTRCHIQLTYSAGGIAFLCMWAADRRRECDAPGGQIGGGGQVVPSCPSGAAQYNDVADLKWIICSLLSVLPA